MVLFSLEQAVDNIIDHFGVKVADGADIFVGIDILWKDWVKFKKLNPCIFGEKRLARRYKKQAAFFDASKHCGFVFLLGSGFNENVRFGFRRCI